MKSIKELFTENLTQDDIGVLLSNEYMFYNSKAMPISSMEDAEYYGLKNIGKGKFVNKKGVIYEPMKKSDYAKLPKKDYKETNPEVIYGGKQRDGRGLGT